MNTKKKRHSEQVPRLDVLAKGEEGIRSGSETEEEGADEDDDDDDDDEDKDEDEDEASLWESGDGGGCQNAMGSF